MKTIAMQNKRKIVKPAYPNAAERSYFLHKLLDGVLALATVVGGLTALVFLLFMYNYPNPPVAECGRR